MNATHPHRPRGLFALYLAAAGGMALILCAVYAVCGFWPFGSLSVMTGDLNSQYIPFYAHFYDALRSGGSLFYAGDMGLGGGAFALFAYYFASPFAWLYLLFAPETYGWLCCLVYALKLILAALAFGWYLGRRWGPCPLFVPLAWCYGLMGYTVAYAQNVLWLDSVILLPLAAAGLDALRKGGRGLGFTLALAAAIFTNFYIGYMLCLFSVLYFAASLAAAPPSGGARAAAGSLGRFVLCGLTAAALAGAILVPAAADILSVKNTALTWDGGVQFDLVGLAQKFFTGNFVWADVQTGLPPVYCGMLGLAGALLYAVSPRPRREKLIFGALTALLVLSMWWQPLDLVWHGFSPPNWFPYRQSFVLVFWLLSLGGAALAGPLSPRRLLGAGALGLLAAGLVFVTRTETYGRRRWAVACLVLGAALVLVWLYERGGQARRVWAVALALVCAGELSLNTVWALGQFEGYPVADYAAFVTGGRATVQAVDAQNDKNLRVEKTFFRTLNDPMLLGYEGMTHFSSVQEGTGALLLMALGYCNYGSSYGYLAGSTAAADSLLGVGYFLDRDGGAVPTHFTPAGIDAPWTVYENENALPRALWSPGTAADFALDPDADPFVAAESLYAALLGEPAGLFTRLEAAETESAYTLTLPGDGIVYAVFTGTGSDVPLTVNGRDAGTVFSLDRSSGAVVDLGRYAAGETVTVALESPADTAVFALLDETALTAACDALRSDAPTVTRWRSGAVTLASHRDSDGLVVLSLPYSEHWQAEVDGAPVAVQPADYLLAVALPAGDHTLTLRYVQPGATAGAALSLAGLAALLLFFRRRPHPHR